MNDASGPTPQTATPSRAAFAFIFITVLLDMLALGVIIPVLPTLVGGFLGGDAADAAWMLGMFGTAWALMQFLFSPMIGALSDRFGRRPVILISNIGLGLDYILMALAPSLWWLFAGRVISGITAASISTGFAYVADVTPADQRAARFGMLGVAFGVGFVIGPALGRARRRDRSAPAVLDRGGLEPCERALRLADPAGVASAPVAHGVRLAARQSARRRSSCCARTANCSASRPSTSSMPRACRAAEHGRALHALPLRLGRAHGRLRARGRRRLRDGGAGRPDRSGGQALRRTQRADRRARCSASRDSSSTGSRGPGIVFLHRHSVDRAVGLRESGVARPDEPARRRRRAGPAAGREPEPAGHRQHDRPRAVRAFRSRSRSGRSSGLRFPARRS